MGTRIGVDTGGTFTDLVAYDGHKFRVEKVPSTPKNPSASTAEAVEKAGFEKNTPFEELIQGTTVATNAIIERRGPVVGLLTTAGFRDVLPAQRIVRPQSFDLEWVKQDHLVPRYLIKEARERVDANGTVKIPLSEEDVREAARFFQKEGVTAVAISFLFSYLNPDNERAARNIITEEVSNLVVSISSDVFGQWREYERTSTCVIDAFLKPVVSKYATEVEEIADLHNARLLLLRSNGGVMTAESTRSQPVSLVRSGPAGGVTAALRIGELTHDKDLILADMGGTSFDTCLINKGDPAITTQAEITWGVPISIPMVDVRSIGAGGGSIAWLDPANILRVGPQSAGAYPGPACYPNGGTQATVTDANLAIGRLGEDYPLAGDLFLNLEKAEKAIGTIARRMDLSKEETALGIIHIADNSMAQALRLVSIDRGFDPRDFTMIAFGGAGPLHASALARALSIGRVIVPVFPGALSAYGALIADTRFDYMRTSINRGRDEDLDLIRTVFTQLREQADEDLRREAITAKPVITYSGDVRYAGQNWDIEIPIDTSLDSAALSKLRRGFHARHVRQFGWNLPDGELELVNLRLVATVAHSRPAPPELKKGDLPSPASWRQVVFDESSNAQKTPVFWRDDLSQGNRIQGPGIVAEMDSTVMIPPGDTATVDAHGNLILSIASE